MPDMQSVEFPVFTLTYRKGDLIIKEGDYGISIYKIIRGSVLVFIERDDKEVVLNTLRPGELLGEIAFLKKTGERRTASARAIEDTELEVWHPTILSKEYMEMAPMLKYVADQLLTRLLRMNHLLGQLADQESKRRKAMARGDPFVSERRYYRKAVDLESWYWPAGLPAKARLPGRIRDISLSGIGLEILTQNTSECHHIAGDLFSLTTVLPNGKELNLTAELVSLKQTETPGKLLVGMSITRLSDEAKKLLGFFLMPA